MPVLTFLSLLSQTPAKRTEKKSAACRDTFSRSNLKQSFSTWLYQSVESSWRNFGLILFTVLLQFIEVGGYLFMYRSPKIPLQHFNQARAWTLTLFVFRHSVVHLGSFPVGETKYIEIEQNSEICRWYSNYTSLPLISNHQICWIFSIPASPICIHFLWFKLIHYIMIDVHFSIIYQIPFLKACRATFMTFF